ncbi:hypothetical protein BLX24_27670 [Arsenicibacter rosenii]|uniref:Uncharacterized protein n=1 Tax=Arsenicibacter rosenii TaxID=1750698 RepID=A0A1S2VD33_9BACT|nr:hypothetical protein BLX24_27670 [Arsenicibacter rosenii]
MVADFYLAVNAPGIPEVSLSGVPENYGLIIWPVVKKRASKASGCVFRTIIRFLVQTFAQFSFCTGYKVSISFPVILCFLVYLFKKLIISTLLTNLPSLPCK